MRISDWSSDVCSSDLDFAAALAGLLVAPDAVAAPPIAPADRQIAAMPGKDLPAIAVVAGAIDIAPETATLAAEAASDEAMPHPADGPQRKAERRVGKEGVRKGSCRG